MSSSDIQREYLKEEEIRLDSSIFKKHKNTSLNNRKASKNRIKYSKYAQ
jgi:hypothetical protein